MKKLLFFVAAAATLLCGCNKDDRGALPVADVDLPTSSAENPITAGSPVTIQGKGFTHGSEIWLRALTKAAAGDVQATVTEVTAAAITFTAPRVAGEQGVILKQDGGEWNLGTLYFTATNEILPRKLTRIVTAYPDEEDKDVDEFTYDDQGRLASIAFDPERRDDMIRIEYAENRVVVKGSGTKNAYRLEKGRTVSSECEFHDQKRIVTTYAYDANGFLSEMVEKGTESSAYVYRQTFQNNSLIQCEGQGEGWSESVRITPDKTIPNNLNLDLCAFLLLAADVIDNEEMLMPYQLGVAGNRSSCLPKQCVMTYKDDERTDTNTYTFEYAIDSEGYITGVRIEGANNISCRFLYEE